MKPSSSFMIAGFGRAPIMVFTTWPLTKRFIVGIEVIPYLIAIALSSSVLSFTILIFAECSVAISSRIGATARHGPHHSAQKSTSTGVLLFSTSASNVAVVTGFVAPIVSPLICSENSSARPGIVQHLTLPHIQIRRR